MNKKIKIIGTLALVFALVLTLQIDSFARERVELDKEEVKARRVSKYVDFSLERLIAPIFRFIKVDVNQRFDDLDLSTRDRSYNVGPADLKEVLDPKDDQVSVSQERSKIQKVD